MSCYPRREPWKLKPAGLALAVALDLDHESVFCLNFFLGDGFHIVFCSNSLAWFKFLLRYVSSISLTETLITEYKGTRSLHWSSAHSGALRKWLPHLRRFDTNSTHEPYTSTDWNKNKNKNKNKTKTKTKTKTKATSLTTTTTTYFHCLIVFHLPTSNSSKAFIHFWQSSDYRSYCISIWYTLFMPILSMTPAYSLSLPDCSLSMLTSSIDCSSTARLFLDDDEEEGFAGGNSENVYKRRQNGCLSRQADLGVRRLCAIVNRL